MTLNSIGSSLFPTETDELSGEVGTAKSQLESDLGRHSFGSGGHSLWRRSPFKVLPYPISMVPILQEFFKQKLYPHFFFLSPRKFLRGISSFGLWGIRKGLKIKWKETGGKRELWKKLHSCIMLTPSELS